MNRHAPIIKIHICPDLMTFSNIADPTQTIWSPLFIAGTAHATQLLYVIGKLWQIQRLDTYD